GVPGVLSGVGRPWSSSVRGGCPRFRLMVRSTADISVQGDRSRYGSLGGREGTGQFLCPSGIRTSPEADGEPGRPSRSSETGTKRIRLSQSSGAGTSPEADGYLAGSPVRPEPMRGWGSLAGSASRPGLIRGGGVWPVLEPVRGRFARVAGSRGVAFNGFTCLAVWGGRRLRR